MKQQRRLFAALDAMRRGHDGDTRLGDFLGLDVHTVTRGRQQLLEQNVVSAELAAPGVVVPPRERAPDTSALLATYSNTIRGPILMTGLRLSVPTTTTIAEELVKLGIAASHTARPPRG